MCHLHNENAFLQARLSPSAVMELEMVAGRALRLLQERPEIAFRLVFMTRSTLWRKCDAFVQVRMEEVLHQFNGAKCLVCFFLVRQSRLRTPA